MPLRQRTFELIPLTLVNSDGPRRPMTSKAAKKAYQQKNKGPRISRAEQRRLEAEERRLQAEELEQQKKEYAKERAAIKSKAGREKKAAKKQVEKDERKRLGLPEPNRFVRASQTTISRFVVKDGNKRSLQQMEMVAGDSDDIICAPENAGPPTKRGSHKGSTQAMVDDESDVEFGDFHPSSQLRALPRRATTIGSAGQKLTFAHKDASADMQPLSDAAVQLNPPRQSPRPANIPNGLPRDIGQSRLTAASTRYPGSKPSPRTAVNRLAKYTILPQKAPLPTQTFPARNLNSLFPSASQQVRELLENIDDLPSNTQIARELRPVQEPPATNNTTQQPTDIKESKDDSSAFICTQDLILSPRALSDIERRSKPRVEERDSAPPRLPMSRGNKDSSNTALCPRTTTAVRQESIASGPASRRGLERTSSTSTDYGDAEFGELDWFTF